MIETTADRIYKTLLERIVTGDLKAEDKLRQDHLARQYETSHVPIREALLRLEAKGLAYSVPHKGTRVASLEPTEIREVIEMRIALESLALSHAIPQMTDQVLANADQVRQDCDAAKTMLAWNRADRIFHLTLLSACKMPRLLASIEDLQILTARHIFVHFAADWVSRNDPDHTVLLEACRNGEVVKARDCLRDHLRRVL